MGIVDIVIKAAAFLGALGAIIAVVVKIFVVANTMKKSIDNFNTTVSDLKDHSKENYMSLLRLTIMSSEMPIGERIVAGYKYLGEGGNGEVKKYLKEHFNIDDTVDEASHYKR